MIKNYASPIGKFSVVECHDFPFIRTWMCPWL